MLKEAMGGDREEVGDLIASTAAVEPDKSDVLDWLVVRNVTDAKPASPGGKVGRRDDGADVLTVNVGVDTPGSRVDKLSVEWQDNDTSDVVLSSAKGVGPSHRNLMTIAESENETDTKSRRWNNAETELLTAEQPDKINRRQIIWDLDCRNDCHGLVLVA